VITWVLAAALALSVVKPTPAVPPAADVPSPEQIMAVPQELRARLQQQVINVSSPGRSRLERLVDFMFQDSGLGMKYAADATSTVEQAYRTHQGNCLTFTLLTLALARESGLLVYGQEIDEVPAWREENNTVYHTNHVNAGISIGQMRFSVDVARDAVIASRPPRRIPDRQLLALYYNNRAAELMASASPAAAAPYMAMSLQVDPRYANSWSNAGVLQLHMGDSYAAERDYLKALTLDRVNTDALFNLVTLYQGRGDDAKSAIFKQRLEKARLKEPYYQFVLGLGDEQQGDYARAMKHYRQAIRVYDGEPRFYFGLARAYQQLGDTRRARHALDRANALDRVNTGNQPPAARGGSRR
jgi:tetratricopeptide (TPR) repeat protein